MSMLTRRNLLRSAAAGAAFAAAPAVAQSNWPSHNVRIIVPFPAGGSTDILFRILADRLKEKFSQSFIVENRPGAGGNVGIDIVAKSAPDGYTIGGATISQFSMNQYLYSRMPYDSERDIMAPSLTYELPNVAVVSAKHVQAKTLAEFIAWAKARPEGVTIGSPGPGTTPHLSGVLFEARTGIKAVHVPFKGAAQTIPAMLAGDVNFAVDNLASYISQIESGNMRALAVTSLQRWPTLPDVPTMAEAGVKDFVITSWAAYAVPSALPRAIIDKLSAAQRELANDPAMQRRFLAAGARILGTTPEEAAAFAAKERVLWKELVRIAGLQPM